MYDHLSPLARRVGVHMAQHSNNGLPTSFGDDLLDAFPAEDTQDLKIALAELHADNLIEATPVIGPKLPRSRTTIELFVAADPGITGHDPRADSLVVAQMLIDKPERGGARELEAETGWPRRRFNPAFALVVPNIAPGRVRAVIQNDYPTLGVSVALDDVVQLKRYIQRHVR